MAVSGGAFGGQYWLCEPHMSISDADLLYHKDINGFPTQLQYRVNVPEILGNQVQELVRVKGMEVRRRLMQQRLW